MRILLILLFICFSNYKSTCQEFYRVKKNTGKVIITPYDNSNIVIPRVSGVFRNARKIIYSDTINGYEVEVSKELEIQETNHLYNFCATIPKEDTRDNAICINSAPKKDYEDFNSFKNVIIENPEYIGENSISWIWGEESKLISFNKELFNSYDSYRANIQIGEKKVFGQFIILETKKSYLWINFIADEDTFEIDITKFEKFIKYQF